jgi:4-diphosphocytidyl-2-C-methyl-D-erythritol kinase
VIAVVAAPAKVNLVLDVLGRRPDGYHEIRTVFQAVDLADEVRVVLGPVGIRVHVTGADVGPEKENLAYRAAEKFVAAFGAGGRGYDIHLTKRIPAGAGLGGGSSDAAAVLRCLSVLASAPPSADEVGILGSELGSDVAFFLGASTLALGVGKGERLSPMLPLPEAHLVLALPPVHVGTADAYRALARGPWDPGSVPAKPTPSLGDWTDAAAVLHNDFEAAVAAAHPEIASSLDALRASGARAAALSGSGAASFGIFQDAGEAARVADVLSETLGWPFLAVRTLREWPWPVRTPR